MIGFLNIVTWSFRIVTLPFMAEKSEDLQERLKRATLSFRYHNYVLIPLTLLVALYPKEIISTLFGAKYTNGDSVTDIKILAFGVLFSAISRLGCSLLSGIGQTQANFA